VATRTNHPWDDGPSKRTTELASHLVECEQSLMREIEQEVFGLRIGYTGSRSLMYRALVPWRGPRPPPPAARQLASPRPGPLGMAHLLG
jgi:hypothetical protein